MFVHFSGSHDHYATAYRYLVLPSVRKPADELDISPFLSADHPPSEIAVQLPATAHASAARASAGGKSRRMPRIVEFAHAIVALKLRDIDAILAHVRAEDRAGRTDLYAFAIGCRDLPGTVGRIWRAEDAPALLERKQIGRVEILHRTTRLDCVCNKKWWPAAEEIFRRNLLVSPPFRMKLVEALQKGVCKGNIVMVIGESDCAKSFLLEPLSLIYATFNKPGKNTSFPLEKLPQYELVLWNEFTFDKSLMSWEDLLNWMDGKGFEIAVKGSVNIKHIPTAPFFATASKRLQHPERDDAQQEMMANRVFYLKLTTPFGRDEVDRSLKPCPSCFAKWVLCGAGLTDENGERPQ